MKPIQAGVVKMTVLPAVDIPAGGTVELRAQWSSSDVDRSEGPLEGRRQLSHYPQLRQSGTQSATVKVLGAAANGPPQASTARRGDTTAGVSTR